MKIYDLMPSVKDLIPYDYEHIRCYEYEDLICYFLSHCSKGTKFEQISGAPGSGKTTFCRKLYGDNFLSFDKIMEDLPAYQNDLQKYGSKIAFQKNEITARIIGYEILRRSIEDKYSLTIEHSGVNRAHLELFNSLKKLNYKTKIGFILCDLETLLERVKIRETITKRHTSQTMVEQRYFLINEYIEKYKKVADEVEIYNSINGQISLISNY